MNREEWVAYQKSIGNSFLPNDRGYCFSGCGTDLLKAVKDLKEFCSGCPNCHRSYLS